jgi:hypothetical protein
MQQYTLQKVMDKKTIDIVAEQIINKQQANILYGYVMNEINKLLDNKFINPISMIILDYTNVFGIEQIRKMLELYSLCFDNNTKNILYASLFPQDYTNLILPKLIVMPNNTKFNGTYMYSGNYISDTVVCVIYFDMPDNYTPYCVDANYQYNVLVITYGKEITSYSVCESVFFQGYRNPIYTEGIHYSYIKNRLALEFEFSIN